jgi:hypothetical protein
MNISTRSSCKVTSCGVPSVSTAPIRPTLTSPCRRRTSHSGPGASLSFNCGAATSGSFVSSRQVDCSARSSGAAIASCRARTINATATLAQFSTKGRNSSGPKNIFMGLSGRVMRSAPSSKVISRFAARLASITFHCRSVTMAGNGS